MLRADNARPVTTWLGFGWEAADDAFADPNVLVDSFSVEAATVADPVQFHLVR